MGNVSNTDTNAFKKTSICYFALKQGASVPSSKLFIRIDPNVVRGDIDVAKLLQRWLSRDSEWKYEDMLRSAFPGQDLDGRVAAHAWLAVSIKKGRLTLESCLSPQLFA